MSVRARLTATAVLVVGIALVAGGAALVWVLGSALTDQVCATAKDRAAEIAAQVAHGNNSGLGTAGELVRVVDATGRVVTASDTVPLDPAPPGTCRRYEPESLEDDYLVATAPVPGGTRPLRVVVGEPLVDVLESTHLLTRALLVGLPVLLLLVGATTWFVTGRTLAPVTAIRREADLITAAGLDRRVPQPARRDEVARLAETVNRMLDRLERAQASQRRFVSDASHELRSPVASIRQYAELALAHPGSTTLPELAGTVLAENLRIQRLVDDLLLLARADERLLTLPKGRVDLDDLVFEEARQLRETTGAEVRTGAVSAGQVRGDATALRRVLRNLGENAVRYARHTVEFALAERDGFVVLDVSDDGPGVPAAERERVFERFVRLDGDRSRDDGGSGLGLAIVAELVRAHGGSVELGDGELGGTRVRVRLPAS